MDRTVADQMVFPTVGRSLILPRTRRRQDSLTVKKWLVDVFIVDSVVLLLGSFKTEFHILKKQNRYRNT